MTEASVEDRAPATSLPRFPVALAPPDLGRWRSGNTGIAGVHSFAATAPGPHLALVALVHGNELAGAIVLERLLRAALRPERGMLTIVFANLAAFDRFDPAQPTASRFVDEDLNRLWDAAVLDGRRESAELLRARQLRPLIEQVDVLLDLHSMLWASEPLMLCGETDKGRALAQAIGAPSLVVADGGHVSGRRLIDYGRFADPAACPAAVLVEAGQHWEAGTVAVTLRAVAGMLSHLGMAGAHPALTGMPLEVAACHAPPRFARVTRAVTASTASFAFTQPFQGGEVVARADTLIATDGDAQIRTSHDDCLLVMPSLRPSRGHTAVRLARFES